MYRIDPSGLIMMGPKMNLLSGRGMRRRLKGAGLEGNNLDTLRNKLQNLKITPHKGSQSHSKKNKYITF